MTASTYEIDQRISVGDSNAVGEGIMTTGQAGGLHGAVIFLTTSSMLVDDAYFTRIADERLTDAKWIDDEEFWREL